MNGYMWIAPANTLNDDFDSIIVADAESEGKRFMDYIMRDHTKTLYTLVKLRGRQYWNEDGILRDISFESFLETIDPYSGEMDTKKIAQLLGFSEDSKAILDRLRILFTQLTDELRLVIDRHIHDLFYANAVVQEHYFVFSMSESYDLGNMWGYYADSGRGFCIEYDFNRSKDLGPAAMRYLLNTYKVIYSNISREIPAEVLAESFLFAPDNAQLKEQLVRYVFDRVLYKDSCWENEKEWRIVLGDTDSRMPVDIVSAIIIDERSLQKSNTKKLLHLCKKRGWQVRVRKNNLFRSSHSYELFSLN